MDGVAGGVERPYDAATAVAAYDPNDRNPPDLNLGSAPDLAEHPCPNCGEPMRAGWGATCGRCKPALAYPKTIILTAADVQGVLPLALGWLVVVRSPGTQLRGTLIDLADPVTILSRAESVGVEGGKVI